MTVIRVGDIVKYKNYGNTLYRVIKYKSAVRVVIQKLDPTTRKYRYEAHVNYLTIPEPEELI